MNAPVVTLNPIITFDASLHMRAQVVACPDCHGLMRDTSTGYPHGVRWVPGGGGTKVDCIGRPVLTKLPAGGSP